MSSIHILDISLGTIAPGRPFGVPVALFVFVFDDFCVTRHALLGSSNAGCIEGLGMGRKRFGENAVDRICPTAVVLDDSIRDMRHGFTPPNKSIAGRGLIAFYFSHRPRDTGYVRTGSYRPSVPYRISVTIPTEDVPYRIRTVSTVSEADRERLLQRFYSQLRGTTA